MTQPLLSICIPTYNREYLIGECLGKICPAAAKYGVEVVVSDNASTDGTEAVIRDYASRYDNLVYVRQSENIGPDANFEAVLRAANGKYRWLMGDGCFVTETSIENLLKHLESNYDAIVVDGAPVGRTGYDKAKEYNEPQNLLEDIGWHMTWLSCLVYSEKLIADANFTRYYNSSFLQTGIIFEYFVSNTCHVLFLPEAGVHSFPVEKKNGWKGHSFQTFCREWFLFVMSLPPKYSVEVKKACIQKHSIKSGLFTLEGLLYLRKQGYTDLNQYKKEEFYIEQVIPYPKKVVALTCCLPKSIITDKFMHTAANGRFYNIMNRLWYHVNL